MERTMKHDVLRCKELRVPTHSAGALGSFPPTTKARASTLPTSVRLLGVITRGHFPLSKGSPHGIPFEGLENQFFGG